jgi:hypothetical protein
MSGPANATTSKGGSRFYTWGEERFWSVTTVIGCLDKPAIPRWSAKRAAEFAVEHADSWLALARTGQKTAAVDLIKNAPWRERDAAADVGTAVHKAVELYTLGQSFPTWADDVAGHMAQFEKFLNAYEPEFELAEASVFHRGHKWAGTLDGICTFKKAPKQHESLVGKRTIFDIKTSNEGRQGHGLYPEIALQLGAYSHAEFIGLPNGDEAPMPEIEAGAGLWLRPDKWAVVPVRVDDEVYNAFRYIIEAFRWATDIAPAVLGKAATAA